MVDYYILTYMFHLVTRFYGTILLVGNKYIADMLQLQFVQFCFEMLLV